MPAIANWLINLDRSKNDIDELQANYRRERQGLEEQSDDLRRAQSHGEQMVMEAEQRLRSALNSLALDGEPLHRAKRTIQQ